MTTNDFYITTTQNPYISNDEHDFQGANERLIKEAKPIDDEVIYDDLSVQKPEYTIPMQNFSSFKKNANETQAPSATNSIYETLAVPDGAVTSYTKVMF